MVSHSPDTRGYALLMLLAASSSFALRLQRLCLRLVPSDDHQPCHPLLQHVCSMQQLLGGDSHRAFYSFLNEFHPIVCHTVVVLFGSAHHSVSALPQKSQYKRMPGLACKVHVAFTGVRCESEWIPFILSYVPGLSTAVAVSQELIHCPLSVAQTTLPW
jgi:hypothetical protein